MHEFTIAKSIVDIAVAAARKENAQKITRVHVMAGELRGIVPLQLTFYFGVASENTIADGARLDLEIARTRGRCRVCKREFVIGDFRYVCPECSGVDIETVGGAELRLVNIEVA
jgi:hydrogenase nickel incorporation protein HypA/HybF